MQSLALAPSDMLMLWRVWFRWKKKMPRPKPKRKSTRAPEIAAKKAKAEASSLDFDLEWKGEGELKPDIPDLIYLDGKDARHSTKVAGFDIDNTITKTKSGRKFPTGPSDWDFLYDCVPKKLKELNDSGTKVVFFTNQAGIEKGKAKPIELQKKFEDIITSVGIPIQVFISTGNNKYRKPSPCMWKFMETNCNGGLAVDLSDSVFVGDAAGRPKNWAPGKPKDISCTDRMFGANVGCTFATPEAFFLGQKEAGFDWSSISPMDLLASTKDKDFPKELHSNNKEIVILVGCPASGKSTIRERYFTPHGYQAVNRDTLGTKEKCLKVAVEALKAGKSVIVDNTNPSKADRKVFIDLAKTNGIGVRCFHLKMEPKVAYHLNMFRQNQSNGEKRRVPEVAYHVYAKNFECPEKSEGFDSVETLEFVAKFDSSFDEELFKQWTSMS